MNIRGVSNLIQTEAIKKKDKSTEQASPDRDPESGGQGEGEHQSRHFTDEELDKIIENIKAHPSIQKSDLLIRIDKSSGIPVVFIEDASGAVVRRIAGSDLASFAQDKDESKGQLLNKAM